MTLIEYRLFAVCLAIAFAGAILLHNKVRRGRWL